MTDIIDITLDERQYQVNNTWSALSPEQYLHLCTNLALMADGKIAPMRVKVEYLADVLDVNIKHIRNKDELCDLLIVAEKVDFMFNISYPNNDEDLQGLDKETRSLLKKNDPAKLNIPIARALSRKDYRYTIDACFCAQLLPSIKVGKVKYQGYKISTSYNMLTCSLTALQYIDARNLLDAPESLPLMAAILYYPGQYSSDGAHSLAETFKSLSPSILLAISLNFTAFNNYLLTKTEFSILTMVNTDRNPLIATGALESLYNLSADGYGDVSAVENMDVIKYLTILRKKLIDCVHSLAGVEMKITDIAKNTGLPLSIINKILS